MHPKELKNTFVEKDLPDYCRYVHDIHQYLFQIRNLAMNGDTERIIGIVNELEGEISKKEIKKYTNDFLLNSILSEYSHKSIQQNVDFSTHIEDNINISFISDSDKISMFGNLLKNALEAAAQCPDKGRIELKIYKGNRHFVVIELKNQYCGELIQRKGKFISTKKDYKNHGMGLQIVSDLAAKYGGELVVEQEEKGVFRAVLYISSNANFS